MITLLKLKQVLKHNKTLMRFWGHFHKERPLEFFSCGADFPDKTFYIIGRDNMIAGGWSLINTVMMHLAYADEKGYIPVVDMQHFRNQYTKENELGKVNWWEKYFEQPAGYSLDDIADAKNVWLCSSALCPDPKFNTSDNSNIWEDQDKLSLFRDIFARYIRFTAPTTAFFESQRRKYLGDMRKFIGVLCRGTDFLVNKPAGHEVQPDASVVLEDVRKEFATGGYDGIFIATEDKDILDMFVAEFGDSLHYVEQTRLSKKELRGDVWLSAAMKETHPEDDADKSFLAYLSAIWILSQCDCLFAGRNNGSKGLLYMPNHYKSVKIYNLGQY